MERISKKKLGSHRARHSEKQTTGQDSLCMTGYILTEVTDVTGFTGRYLVERHGEEIDVARTSRPGNFMFLTMSLERRLILRMSAMELVDSRRQRSLQKLSWVRCRDMQLEPMAVRCIDLNTGDNTQQSWETLSDRARHFFCNRHGQ